MNGNLILNNIDFLSTPFEITSLESLVKSGLNAIKVSSCNLTNLPFLKKVADSNLAVLLSTGMGNLEEVKEAYNIFKKNGNDIIIFQCTSNYPSKIINANLNVINTYKDIFNCPVGLSDHTNSNITSIVATALGVDVIEKHFTLSKKLEGIDQKSSIEPNELSSLIGDLKDAKDSLGSKDKYKTEEEEGTLLSLRRSIVASRDLKIGEIISENMISMKRPGTGLSPMKWKKIFRKRAKKNFKEDELIKI